MNDDKIQGSENGADPAPVHREVMPVPECMSDAPNEVIDAAKEIARASLNTIRNIIAEEFPATNPETQKDFVKAICQIMAESA
jgi:uncharacterized protein with HEPN domain